MVGDIVGTGAWLGVAVGGIVKTGAWLGVAVGGIVTTGPWLGVAVGAGLDAGVVATGVKLVETVVEPVTSGPKDGAAPPTPNWDPTWITNSAGQGTARYFTLEGSPRFQPHKANSLQPF